MDKNPSQLGSLLKGILLGSILAAGIALFTAPRSGVETRRMLREKGQQLQSNVTQSVEKAREQVDSLVSDTRQRADQIVHQFGKQADAGNQTGSELQ
jgi:gas vesicle protein